MNPTPAQQNAIEARGNVLVSAAAGTGKTATLTARVIHCLKNEAHAGKRTSLQEILVVTFTEAAAAEMRGRIRSQIEAAAADAVGPDAEHWQQQLALFDAAHIGTLHSFCLKLARQHFYALGIDPQFRVMSEGEARMLADEALNAVIQQCHEGKIEIAEAVEQLIQFHAAGGEKEVRGLVLKLHEHVQTRPNPGGWFERQLEMFASPQPALWREWLLDAIRDWRERWLPELERESAANEKARECSQLLKSLPKKFSRDEAAGVLKKLEEASKTWPSRMKTKLEKPLKPFFEEVTFLASVAVVENGKDPLAEDWEWTRGPVTTLLRLAQAFENQFDEMRRDAGLVDFHDLEQFALQLLCDFKTNSPSATARQWRERLKFVFVDEYQDINAAQDKIIEALSRDGAASNRFLVGDVKQSIYRFRQSNPAIFRRYSRQWTGKAGKTLALTDNFRSREDIIDFANSLFSVLLTEDIGGVNYDDTARLKFGAPEERKEKSRRKDSPPCVELLLHTKANGRDETEGNGANIVQLRESEKEARQVALHLKRLREAGINWSDMAVLLRAPSGKGEIWAREFHKTGVPLHVERGGFFDNTEITDLLSLLALLDNPLQDLPLLAVLRSPFVGLSLDELAEIRLASPKGSLWSALLKWKETETSPSRAETRRKVDSFLARFGDWRKLSRQASLSRCLETILQETGYAEWLRGQARGELRFANVQQLLELAQQFDEFQRQGLFRFLGFIESQREAEVEPEVPPSANVDAVRLMSIHQSKGLEFPVVVLADLGKGFNPQDLRGSVILDDELGMCPQIKAPNGGGLYPSLPNWMARRRAKMELWGEELRLLYVAVTRARDRLILSASVTQKKLESLWQSRKSGDVTWREMLEAKSFADWLGLWFARTGEMDADQREGQTDLVQWRILDGTELTEPAAHETGGKRIALPELDKAEFARLRGILEWQYPFGETTHQAAKTSVTALRRQAMEQADDEAEALFRPPSFRRPTRVARQKKLSAAEIGLAHHKFLQWVSLDQCADAARLRLEAKRLEQQGIFSKQESAALDFKALARFWTSELGKEIRNRAGEVKRELPFTARVTPAELQSLLGTTNGARAEDEFIVVQGVADLVLVLENQLWIVDFKTDDVKAGEAAAKAAAYATQLKLYASALGKIFGRKTVRAWLHFLATGETVELEDERLTAATGAPGRT